MNQPSPYTPGVVAKSVPGRRAQLRFYTQRAEEIVSLGRFIGRVRVDHAARGVGKTSLLREAERIFTRQGAATVFVTANEDENLLGTIAAELQALLPAAQRRAAEIVELVESVSFSVGAGPVRTSVTVRPGAAASASAGKTFKRLLKKVTEQLGRGVVVLVDEVQSADKPSLRAIAQGWQELASDDDPPAAGMFFVGLPGSVDHIVSAATFAERFSFQPLLGIDEAGSAEALVLPAQALGVTWEPEALRLAVSSTNGYPYKVQLMGEAAWEAAGEPDPQQRLTVENVNAALPSVDKQMRTLFTARWRSASVKQRELMVAIAELGGVDVKREDIARRLGVDTKVISVPREKLLQKGLIDANRHGYVSFTLPGFTEYVLEQR